MAGGWARDGVVEEQIEASINDELRRMQARRGPVGESRCEQDDCEGEQGQAAMLEDQE